MSTAGQSANEASPATPDDTAAGAKSAELPPPRRRDQRFRIALLEKLSTLSFTSWSAKQDFEADEDWAGIVSLRSDAVLGPLEPLVPAQRAQ
jgi:hypothetical protein